MRHDGSDERNAFESAREARAPGLISRVRDGAAGMLVGRAVVKRQRELMTTLHEVASAVSSATSVDEVLDSLVDRAKVVTDTDKAVLVLTDHHDGHLDLDTLVVRGQRGQHSQEWWEERLGALGEKAFAAGEPVIEHFAAESALILASPVRVRDHNVGLLGAINSQDRPFVREQIEYISILSAFAAAAIENAQLAEQSRYVLLASERDRIASEMHDGVVQSLFSISLGMELCKRQVARDPAGVADRLDELQERLNRSMTELRRFIYDLRPMKLSQLGLVGALELWIAEVTVGSEMRGHLVIEGDMPRMTPAQESCIYRIAKEAVSNAVRHSNGSRCEVRIAFSDGWAVLTISDDGDGFDSAGVLAGETAGLGLRGIRDRVEREGGILGVSSMGNGTVIKAEVPIGGAS